MINKLKTKRTIRFCIAVVLVFFLIYQISINGTTGIIAESQSNPEIEIQYWNENVIISDANISALSSSGTGTEGDPYIIENLNMNTTSGNAIKFDGVSLSTYWVLRDSHIIGGTYGVYISDSISGKGSIINCTIEADLTIGTPNANYLTVDNCTLISSQGSGFNRGLTFTNNIVQSTSKYSVHLGRIRDQDNIITNNVFYGNNSELKLQSIYDSTIQNNVLVGAGFNIDNNDIVETTSNTIEGNTIDGKPYGFFYNKTGEVITGDIYGQIYLFNSFNSRIEDHTLSGSQFGIQIHNCTNIVVDNVEISGRNGIEVKESEDILIENSDIEGYSTGIDLNSVSNTLLQNNHLSGFNYGIDGFWANGLRIHNNTLLENDDMGIYLDDCDNIEIIFNIVTINVENPGSEPALGLWGCEDVFIYYNVFINLGNNTESPVVGSSSSFIMWYNATLGVGNHYSDWNGTGTYSIPGNDGSVDLYPWIDIDGDTLLEYTEVTVYHTSPFEADTDGDGFSDYDEILSDTDPLNPRDYPGKGRVLALVLGLLFGLGIPAGLVVFARSTKGNEFLNKILGKGKE